MSNQYTCALDEDCQIANGATGHLPVRPDHPRDFLRVAVIFDIKTWQIVRTRNVRCLQEPAQMHNAHVQLSNDSINVSHGYIGFTPPHWVNADRRAIDWIGLKKERTRHLVKPLRAQQHFIPNLGHAVFHPGQKRLVDVETASSLRLLESTSLPRKAQHIPIRLHDAYSGFLSSPDF
jgi:hypothetical protein